MIIIGKKKRNIVIALIITIVLLFFITPKHVGRYFYWNFADLNDYKKFDKLCIQRGESIPFYVYPSGNFQFKIPYKFSQNENHQNFNNFLEEKESVAFLVLKEDSLLYENYFSGYDESSVIPSFSIAKSYISALTGIAIDEGYITNTSQSVTTFLTELKSPEFDKITIEDLLNMRSGINFSEEYSSPFADMPKYYYGTDLKKYIKSLKIKEEPNQSYNYISVNTLLLSLILEKATNLKLNIYAEKKLWKPLGMEFDASWSIDCRKNKTIKSFCCLNARARDFARFGLLYLNQGKWHDKQIIPNAWVKRSTSIINDSRDSQGYPYTYHWRVLENGSFFAKGILGQYIFVYPEKNLVFVRMGKDYAGIDWADFFQELAEQI